MAIITIVSQFSTSTCNIMMEKGTLMVSKEGGPYNFQM